ncbi:MAG: acyl-CoA desaturase [Bacteroidetes bacterium]|nr:acyl-CoA desaturase [Bacteroidota bacterium]
MEQPKVVFNQKQNPEFFKIVTKRVNDHFQETKTSRHANFAMKFKSALILLLYFIPLSYLIFGDVTSVGMQYGLWAIAGLGMVGIGLTIMHDANHGAYSSKKWVNDMMGGTLNLVGAYNVNWKIQHNVFHHTYTNIVGYDEDIRKTIIRFTPKHPYKAFHKFQAFYISILYMIFPFVWIVSKDFDQYSRFSKQNLYERMGRSNRKALLEIIVIKVLYWPTTLMLPIYASHFGYGHTLAGFFMHHFISGIILALATQPAHVGDDMQYFVSTDNDGNMENSWAVHQVITTANFAENSPFITWCFGGLNYQIEHHLFPTVCHVHYPEISKIVRQTCAEFNLPYKSHRTFFDALMSHYGQLHKLGVKVA